MSILVKDSFNRANSTTTLGNTETGQTWKYGNNSVWGIYNNAAYCVSGSNPVLTYVDAGQSDVDITVKVTTVNDNNAIIFRIDSSINSYFELGINGVLTKFNEGNSNDHVTIVSSGQSFVSGDIARIVAQGNTITGYKNGIQIFTTTSIFNQTMTKHGLGSWRGGANGANGLWDDFQISDLASSGNSYTKSLSDSISTIDSITKKNINSNKVLSDSISATESILKKIIGSKNIIDSVSLSDSIKSVYTPVGSNNYTKTLNDSVSISDSLSKQFVGIKTLSDSLSSSDSITNKKSSYIKSLVNNVTISDSFFKQFNVSKSLSDSVNLSDNISKRYNVSKSLVDSLSISDSLSLSGAIGIIYSTLLFDSVVINDSIVKGFAGFKSLADSISTFESILNKKISYNKALSDPISVLDLLNNKYTGNKPLADSITIIDIPSYKLTSVKNYSINLSETITLMDLLSGNFLDGTHQIKSKVYLNGNQNLKVYLQGSRVFIIRLKGDV